MLTLTVMVCGGFSLSQINIALLPKLTYPDIRVVVQNKNVPATIMENEVTRQLEEQLAITEGVIHVDSTTKQGRTSVALSFKYGQDINIALRDASTRLDRAKRFLPEGIDPPIIYKRDPSQIPVAEYIVSSDQMPLLALRDWSEYHLSKWLINIEGVAATEIGGGYNREIQIEVNPEKLAQLGLNMQNIAQAIRENNQQTAAGRLTLKKTEINIYTDGEIKNITELATLPIQVKQENRIAWITLADIATIKDSHEEERLKIRLNHQSGVKLSIQKQPDANTIAVVKAVNARLLALKESQLIPSKIQVTAVSNQAKYIQHALNNTLLAAFSGACLAMFIVFLFLGDMRRTLIIGSAIPIALLATFIPMQGLGLTLNMMTFGGLALGVGLLVDNTIVMLDNIVRHQQMKSDVISAAEEVKMPIIASTSTNLAAILPFLFISGLIGLLFKELIFTLSFAIVSSLFVALTLVPALANQIKMPSKATSRWIDYPLKQLQKGYAVVLRMVLAYGWLVIALFMVGALFSLPSLLNKKSIFLPKFDEGQIYLSLSSDPSSNIHKMDQITQKIEDLLSKEPSVAHFFTTVGGFVFGRSTFESSNRSSIRIQLKPLKQRHFLASQDWIKQFRKKIKLPPDIKVRLHASGLRGIRINRGGDDLVLRIRGNNLKKLDEIALKLEKKLKKVKGLSNIQYSNEDKRQELALVIDRQKAAVYGLTLQQIGEAVRYAISGVVVSDLIEDDRAIGLRLRYQQSAIENPNDLKHILIKTDRHLIQLNQVVQIKRVISPAVINRDNQQRIVELSASFEKNQGIEAVMQKITPLLSQLQLPEGYRIYETGALTTLQDNRTLTYYLVLFAIFLVFVVMAIQYESLRHPLIIMLSIPFSLIGVYWGLEITQLPLSMPVWLGIIMLIGIVVNNAIILVEQIEICRQQIKDKTEAIIQACQYRLRPILMTTLTTVIGMSPLAFSLSEGAEMLQPLAIVIISGLSFSLWVSLILIPIFYFYFSKKLSH